VGVSKREPGKNFDRSKISNLDYVQTYAMKTPYFLILALALGALIGSVLHPSPLEIAIVAVVASLIVKWTWKKPSKQLAHS
jgi:hypothetical protein